MNTPPLAPEPASRPDWLHEEQHQITYRVELSAIYHAKRERFLLTCERAAQAIAALAATAAFAQVVDPKSWAFGVASLLAAAASIAPLVFAWAARANKHATLAGDHRRLLGRIKTQAFDLTEHQVLAFRGELSLLEATEQASLGALVVHCQNEIAAAAGHASSVVPLKWYQWMTMHAIDWSFASERR